MSSGSLVGSDCDMIDCETDSGHWGSYDYLNMLVYNTNRSDKLSATHRKVIICGRLLHST